MRRIDKTGEFIAGENTVKNWKREKNHFKNFEHKQNQKSYVIKLYQSYEKKPSNFLRLKVEDSLLPVMDGYLYILPWYLSFKYFQLKYVLSGITFH